MDHLWSPWRYQYIVRAADQTDCVFCRLPEKGDDRQTYILCRANWNFVILNLFPYTSGHLMVVPFEHQASLAAVDEKTTNELMELTKLAQRALEREYTPDGFNIGLNLGRCAGAGVADHLHMHVVPRWSGDASFTSTIGETRILPEELETTFERLHKYFAANVT